MRKIFFLIFIIIFINMFAYTNNSSGLISKDVGYIFVDSLVVGTINDFAYSPNGEFIALASSSLPEIVDPKNLSIIRTYIGQKGKITSIDISEQYVISGSEDGSIFLWDYDGNIINKKVMNSSITKIKFNNKGDCASVISKNDVLTVFSIPQFKIKLSRTIQVAVNRYFSYMDWNPMDTLIGLVDGAGLNSYVAIFDSNNGNMVNKLYGSPNASIIVGIDWSISNFLYVIINENDIFSNHIEIWDIENNKVINRIPYQFVTYSISGIPNSDLLLSANGEHVYIWHRDFLEYQHFYFPGKNFKYIISNPIGNEFIAFSSNSEEMYLWIKDDKTLLDRPNIKIVEPGQFQTYSEKIQIKGIAWGTREITEVRIKIDNDYWDTAKGTELWEIQFDISNLKPGLHTITAISYDDCLYSKADVLFFSIESMTSDYDFFIGFTFPNQWDVVSGTVMISGYFIHQLNYLPEKISISIDSNEWFPIEEENHWKYSLNTTKLTNGKHIVHAKANDGTRWSNSASLILLIENESPPTFNDLIFIDSPKQNQIVSNTLEITGHSITKDVNVHIKIVTNNKWENVTNGLNWKYTLDTTSFQDGALLFTIRGSLKNETQSINRIVIVDNNKDDIPPMVKITYPKNDEKYKKISRINGFAEDDINVETVLIRINSDQWHITDGTANWSYALDNLSFKRGILTIEAISYDGNRFSDIDTVRVHIAQDLKNDTNTNSTNESPLYLTVIDSLLPILIIFSLIIISIIVLFLKEKRRRKLGNQKRKKRRKTE